MQDIAQNKLLYVLHTIHWNGTNFPKTQQKQKLYTFVVNVQHLYKKSAKRNLAPLPSTFCTAPSGNKKKKKVEFTQTNSNPTHPHELIEIEREKETRNPE